MAKVEFLLQAVTRHNHADHLNKLFRQGCEVAIISVAFARTQGVQAIYQAIAAAGPKASVFVGIRNDITSYQALELLLSASVNHVIPVTDAATVKALFDTGRLSDETIKPANPDTAKAQPAGGALDPMPLHRSFPSAGDFYRVWQSNELKERDLNVPSGGNTNPTGSMYWKKGAYEIDQRHYFRDNVFAGLDWEVDARLPHYERTSARFHLYAAGEFKGTFELKLSHNTNTESTTYKQSNSMTQVSWGDAKPVVARRSLLGRIMHLYRKDSTPPEYMIEID